MFATQCNACHPNANAGIGPALHGSAFASRYPDDATLINVVRRGKGGMPAFPASLVSDQDGRYRIALAPGRYVMHVANPQGRPFPRPASVTVVVPPGRYATENVRLDTGIR